MSQTNPSKLRSLTLVLAASAGLAVPAVAFASHGADDPAGDDRTTTTTTTGSTGATGAQPVPAASGRARAVAAAKARVGGETTVVRMRRKNGDKVRWEVRLTDGTFRWTVREDRRFRVVRVQRERVRAAGTTTTGTSTTPVPTAPGNDDGTADQGSGDAPRTSTTSDAPATHDAGDDHGSGGHGADDAAGDDHGGRHGGHGSDD